MLFTLTLFALEVLGGAAIGLILSRSWHDRFVPPSHLRKVHD